MYLSVTCAEDTPFIDQAEARVREGRRNDAAREATDLLRRLPESAPQRAEVERLLYAVRPPKG